MVINNPVKFRQDILNGPQVTERIRYVTDRQTYRQTDYLGKKNMSPTPEGGDMIIK